VGKERIEAFSDGVFAVAITLLVLDLRVPSPGHGSVAHQLGDQWPQYAAYLVSFLVVGIIWVNHHTLISKLARVDRPTLFLNLLLLVFVVLIPFPTSLVAAYLRHGASWDAKVAVAFYSLVMECMGLAFAGIYVWAGRHHELLHESVDVQQHRSAFRQFGMGSVAYLALAALAFVNAVAALAGHVLLAGFYVFDRTSPTSPDSSGGPV
jgi:uncharacterized membrane protein